MSDAAKTIGSERFAVPIKCPTCGQVGSTAWKEERLAAGGTANPSQLLSVSNGFYLAEGLTESGSPKIICDHCETVLPD